MTDEAINRAIAEACGWTVHHPNTITSTMIGFPPGSHQTIDDWEPVPNYCRDLNAMHEAEGSINSEQLTVMNEILAEEVIPPDQRIWRATARQRAEAFLRTLGKWEEPTP
jgi:hypothetical protein